MLKKYVEEVLQYQADGSLSLSAKLFAANLAFCCILGLKITDDEVNKPVVVLGEMQENLTVEVSKYLTAIEENLLRCIQKLPIANLPPSVPIYDDYWQPDLLQQSNQNPDSVAEQKIVLDYLLRSIDDIIFARARQELSSNHIVLGEFVPS